MTEPTELNKEASIRATSEMHVVASSSKKRRVGVSARAGSKRFVADLPEAFGDMRCGLISVEAKTK